MNQMKKKSMDTQTYAPCAGVVGSLLVKWTEVVDEVFRTASLVGSGIELNRYMWLVPARYRSGLLTRTAMSHITNYIQYNNNNNNNNKNNNTHHKLHLLQCNLLNNWESL